MGKHHMTEGKIPVKDLLWAVAKPGYRYELTVSSEQIRYVNREHSLQALNETLNDWR